MAIDETPKNALNDLLTTKHEDPWEEILNHKPQNSFPTLQFPQFEVHPDVQAQFAQAQKEYEQAEAHARNEADPDKLYYDRQGKPYNAPEGMQSKHNTERERHRERKPTGGNNYYDRDGKPHAGTEGSAEDAEDKAQESADAIKAQQAGRLGMRPFESPGEILKRLQERVAQMNKIMQGLGKLFIILHRHGINIDKDYVRNILRLPMALAGQVLENSFVLEVVREKYRWQKEGHPKPSSTPPDGGGGGSGDGDNRGRGSSGGGGGNNSTGTDDFHFDKDLAQALSDALSKWDIDAAIKTLAQCGWRVDRSILDKVPAHLRARYSFSYGMSSGSRGGLSFVYMVNDAVWDMIRLMQGTLSLDFAAQQRDYVKVISAQQVLGQSGTVLSDTDYENPGYHPDAHIPLNEWIRWQKWNEK
jgi:hypothetical protein